MYHIRSSASNQGDQSVPVIGSVFTFFIRTYPVLCEGLESVFGMMMSNSRLCEQIHGMMCFGLSSTIGMDQSDAIQTYATGTDFDMKRERRETAKSTLPEPPKKKYRQVKHNHIKVLQHQLGTQLVEQSKKFGISAKAFLAQPGHGIPTATDISIAGRRVQDSANLKAHVDAEKKMAAKLTRVKLTADSVKAKALSVPLSNDAVMKLGDERLTMRIKLAERSVLKYWKDFPIPEGIVA